MIVIDTDVAIHWRDNNADVIERLASLPSTPAISVITRVELENGVYRDPAQAERRRARVDVMLAALPVLDFTSDAATIYGRIVDECGFSRRRTADRMIAATAVLHGAKFITLNGPDYREVPGLDLAVWPSPTPRPS